MPAPTHLRLPSPTEVRHALTAWCALEAALSPIAETRHFRATRRWRPAIDLIEFVEGSGDDFHALFAESGSALVKGFAHESPMSPYELDRANPHLWPGIFDGVPSEFTDALADARINRDDTTWCIWWERQTEIWRQGVRKMPD